MSNNIVVTAVNNDPYYVVQLQVMLTSMRINSPDTRVIAYLSGFEEDDPQIAGIQACNPSVTFRHLPPVDGRVQAAASEITAISKTMDEADLVAWIDVDTIIRGDLAGLWEDMRADAIKILFRPRAREAYKMNTGVFVMDCSDTMREFVTEWERRTVRDNRWPAEQRHIYLTYQAMKDRIRRIQLPWILNNLGASEVQEPFRPEAVIWHCKRSHFEHRTYQAEFISYMRKIA